MNRRKKKQNWRDNKKESYGRRESHGKKEASRKKFWRSKSHEHLPDFEFSEWNEGRSPWSFSTNSREMFVTNDQRLGTFSARSINDSISILIVVPISRRVASNYDQTGQIVARIPSFIASPLTVTDLEAFFSRRLKQQLILERRVETMTYARTRLWLGITGVGSIVVLTSIAMILGLPTKLASNEPTFGLSQILELAAFATVFVAWLMPLDFLGGYWFPKKFGKSKERFAKWFLRYLPAVIGQAALFVGFGSLILLLSQALGIVGGFVAIFIGMIICYFLRSLWIGFRQVPVAGGPTKLNEAVQLVESWNIQVPKTVVVKHHDIGFTGGIIGFGRGTRIVIPQGWLEFPVDKLGTAIARRSIALESGSYLRGIVVAISWNIVGIIVCGLIPGAGLSTVAGLGTTICAFTIWAFLGLLTLPTVSRNASLKMDQILRQSGLDNNLILETAYQLDHLQDGEPERTAYIETIFHPIPSVASRVPDGQAIGWEAWQAARTMLFFSWPCLNFLSRSVHCNIGRPELWNLLPSD